METETRSASRLAETAVGGGDNEFGLDHAALVEMTVAAAVGEMRTEGIAAARRDTDSSMQTFGVAGRGKPAVRWRVLQRGLGSPAARCTMRTETTRS
ncbi:hypothetical protein E2562_012484 [Oryza meyeriana var. granulata]|uniref:Uncharacterized protein n=1 Tax=Oryza meyeriana var. granulata TaxID=110450 RepID=A0A6G1BWI3_9ORYZ|nr:hypothetical protein E2562_012484 [Oryza meyeriana var. granulata]